MLRMPGSKAVGVLAAMVAVALLAASCGGSGGKKTTSTTAGGKGGDMLLLASTAPAGSPDPQVNYTLQEWQLLIITHDGLVAFKRAAGTEGTKIVPDLAESLPKPTDGGKTYTFTLRPGIKFSNGQPVTGQDVKATFERLFKIGNSPNAGTWYNVIEGGDACVKTPKTCDLSKGIVVNGNKVTFHLVHGNPEFFDQLAVPFAFILPANTPTKNVNIPPPGTGPYKWAEYSPNKEIKLVRNPYFKVWSSDAQPAGNPNTIIQKFGLSVEAEYTQVEQNQADWVFDQPPADRLNELGHEVRRPGSHQPADGDLLHGVQRERAAVQQPEGEAGRQLRDRPERFGEDLRWPEHCRPDLPGAAAELPRLRAVLPVHEESRGSGKWTAPDLAKAKQLIEQSGTKGANVKVTTTTTPSEKSYGLYFVGLLNSLGYKASLQALSSDIQYPYIQNTKNHVQFSFSDWYQDYPAASDFLNILLGCDSFHPNSNSSPNIAGFCSKPIQSKMDQAATTGITNPSAANTTWAEVDRDVTDQAPWVSMFNPKYIDFLSSRVKGYQFSPQWYFLLDQASVE